MNKIISTLATASVVAAGAAAAQPAWVLDNAHTKVKFSVSHLVISDVEGNFGTFAGTLRAAKPDFSDADIEFSVDVASVSTENEMRDNHLRSDDFFNAEKYPKMTFKSISWSNLGGNKAQLEGYLTIRNITRRVVFDVTTGGTIQDPWGNTRAGFKATAVINRFDFGLKFNALTDAGGAVVGKDVTMTLNLEFTKEKAS